MNPYLSTPSLYLAELRVTTFIYLSPGKTCADLEMWGRPFRVFFHPHLKANLTKIPKALLEYPLVCRLFPRTDTQGRFTPKGSLLRSLEPSVEDKKQAPKLSFRLQGSLLSKQQINPAWDLLRIGIFPNPKGRLEKPFDIHIQTPSLLSDPFSCGQGVLVTGGLNSELVLVAEQIRPLELINQANKTTNPKTLIP